MSDSAIVATTIDRSQHVVLVVDDNPATRYATARVLRAAGFRTAEAETGGEALQRAADNISAVVLDVNLPDMDGFEVCRRLRADPRTAVLPVIHLSAAFVEDRHKVQGLDAGADAYITHPAEPPILVATVQALVRARMAEDRLRSSEMKFRAIYLQAESGISLVDAQGRFSDANPAMLTMLGRAAEDVLNRPVSDFAPPEWKDFVHRKMVHPAEHDQLWRESFPLLHADGHWVHLEWSMSTDQSQGMRVGVASNISERLQLEQRRQALLEREQAARLAAERHSQTKDDFIAVLSHELRNPLNAMTMALHVLTAKGLTPELAKSVGILQKNAKTQARIISDILDVSRINSGKLTLSREFAHPGALVAASIDSMGAALAHKRLRVESDLGPDDPPMWLDPTRFQQVFWNIFSNAVKFSHAEGRIRVALRRSDTALALTVADEGAGIEPAFIESIFEKFSQSPSSHRSATGGLGLGMSIVRHLVELHAGRVSVCSEGLGHGTTVQVTLPVQQPGDDAGAAGEAGAAADAAEAGLRGLKILVVEDDLHALDMLAIILRDRHATVLPAHDYPSAMQAYAGADIDVVVADIGLPGKDGYALMRELRLLEAARPAARPMLAVAVTAFGRPVDREAALAAGFDSHIAKPLQPLDLISTITRLRRGD